MGKENWKLSDLVKHNTNRYNPYSTPPYLRPLKELRKVNLYQAETSSLINSVNIFYLIFLYLLKKKNFKF